MSPVVELRVAVDCTNPGQYFACCGLLELAARMWGGVEGWFTPGAFHWHGAAGTSDSESLKSFLAAVGALALRADGDPDDTKVPIVMETGRVPLRLDWWLEKQSAGDRLKVWAGTMRNYRIAKAMQACLRDQSFQHEGVLDAGCVVYEPDDLSKKVEPFYFDARRGANAMSLDLGFSPDSLGMTSIAYPAVEFLTLVGLQRFRPAPMATPRASKEAQSATRRVFRYFAWSTPLPVELAACAASGALDIVPLVGYEFENAFRTDQKKHKAFTNATAVARS